MKPLFAVSEHLRENACVTENEIARHIVDAAFKIHTTLGPGLLESVYEAVMEGEFARVSATVKPQLISSVG